MIKNSIFSYFFLVLAFTALVSCDSDPNEIGADIVGNDNFQFEGDLYNATAYTVPTGPVEVGNLPVQQFGVYDNPVFGTTKAHVVTQATLAVENPIDFSLEPEIWDVTLVVPYFSTKETVNQVSQYRLDSIYGKSSNKINLSIYESTAFIETDPATSQVKKYYSNDSSTFTTGDLLYQNAAFEFSPEKHYDTTYVDIPDVGDRFEVGPRLEVKLNKTVLGPKFFGPQAVGKFITQDVFKNYFKGLHFRVGTSDGVGRLAMMDFSKGEIRVKYKVKRSATSTADKIKQTMVIKLNGNNVNLLEYENKPFYQDVLNTAPNVVNGDKKLYLKGGEGSMAVVELFRTEAELNELKAANGKWLVNEANLEFFIAQNDMVSSNPTDNPVREPKRIYIYDLSNKVPLLDYIADQSTATQTKYGKTVHNGILDKVYTSKGVKYKIRITNYIKTLITSTVENRKNVRLGLVVTENINVTSNKGIKTAIQLPFNNIFGNDTAVEEIPTMSTVNPLGTILYGSNYLPGEADYDKRLKLTIYYTKPN